MYSEFSSIRRTHEVESRAPNDYCAAASLGSSSNNNGSSRSRDFNPDNSSGEIAIANVNPHEVDVLLATELQQLSFRDREAVHEEIHGVRTLAPAETPAMIDEALRRMQDVVSTKILAKPAYDRAMAMDGRLVHDRGFRLKFLRANQFDATKAAWNFTRYLELLCKYFGPEALTRPLLFSDLTGAEIDLLRLGHMQLLPTRDRSGRRLINVFGLYRKEHSVASKMRLALYVYGLASDDEESRHHGLVLIIAPTSEQQTISDPEEHFEVAKIARAMPFRLAAIHICLPHEGPMFQLLRATVVLLFARDQRIRVKVHTGLKTECRYQLMTYGIPVDDLASNEDGVIDTKSLGEWIQRRRALDEILKKEMAYNGSLSLEGSFIVECPGPRDILFSQGGNSWSHVGNVKFRELLELNRKAHSGATTNEQKSRMIMAIVELLERNDCRFLTWDKPNGWWVRIVEPTAIRSKVAIAMRDHIKRANGRAKQQITESCTSQFSNQDLGKRKQPDGMNCLNF